MPVRFGTSRAWRKATALIASFLLVLSMAGSASANVGTITISAQTPNPVAVGNTVTFTVNVANTSGANYRFAVTGATGVAGLTVVNGGCARVNANSSGNLGAVQIGTPLTTPVGTTAITLTVTQFANNDNGCATPLAGAGMTGTRTVNLVTRNPLAVTYYKAICPRYTDVPANENPSNVDATGGFWRELNTSYQTALVNPATDLPSACPTHSGWSFQFKDGQNGNVIDTRTTGAGGNVTVYLSDAEIDLARGGGLWLQEVAQASASFGAIRCYDDNLNGDNLENIQGVPEATTQVYCIAYNVGGPGISLTKTADAATYVLGQTIHYTYNVIDTSNVNTGSAQFTVSDDKVNGNVAFNCGNTASLTPNTGTLASPSAGSYVTCQTSHLVTQADIDAGTITNTASASYTRSGITYNSNTAVVTVTGPTRSPSVSLSKTANPTTYTKGTVVTYSYVFTNTGNVTLTNLSVADDKIVSPATVTCPAAPLAPGAKATCTASYTISTADLNGGPTVTNHATGTASFGAQKVTATANATVTKAVLTITAPSPSRAYGAGNPTFTPTYSGFLNGETSTSLTTQPTCTTTATSSSAVGTYPVNCTGAVDSSYTIVYVPGTLTVNKAVLTVTADAKSRAYGVANPALTYTITGFATGDTQANSTTGAPGLSTTAGIGSPVGSYTITTAVGSLTATNYSFTPVNGTLTITKAVLTVTADPKSKTYHTANPTLTYTITGYLNGDTSAVVSGTPGLSTTATTNSAVGSYTITTTVGGMSATNYSFTPVNGTLTITKAVLTVTADAKSKTYGVANPALTYTITGFASGENQGNSTTGTPGLSTTATTGSPVGSYPITTTVGTLSATNYSFTPVNGTLTIAQRDLTIRANDQSKTYGTVANLGTTAFTITSGSLLSGDSITGVTLTSTGSPVTAGVGTYHIIASAATGPGASNYNITYDNGHLTVNKAVLTVTADAKSKTYGAANPALTYTITGFATGDTQANSTTGAPSLSTTAVTGSPVGSYTITTAVGSLSAANYSFTPVNGTLTVNKAVLTVTADPKSRAYGAANPTLTATISGYVNGDTSAVVSGTPGLSTTATASSAVGNYTITTTVGTLSATNYSFTPVNGTLTVTKLALTVKATDQSKTYGASLNLGTSAFSITSGALLPGDNITGVTLASLGTPAAAPAGNYDIVASAAAGSGVSNYDITYAKGTLKVNKADLTITAGPQNKTYGTVANLGTTAFTISSGVLVNGDTITGVTLTSTGTPASAGAGGYDIVPSAAGPDAANYNITYSNGTLTVNKATITVTADDKTRPYGVANPAFTATYSGFVNGQTSAVLSGSPSLTTTATTTTPVGSYDITAAVGTLSAANYDFSFVDGTLVIGKPILTITASSGTMAYGGTVPAITPSFSGFVNGDGPSNLYGTLTCGTTATSTSSVGGSPYTTACTGAGSEVYDIHYVDGTLSVTKAMLTVTGPTLARDYGTTNPALPPSIAGYVNGENAAAMSTAPTCDTGANLASLPGSYPVTCSGGVSDDYDFTYVDGALTVGAIPAPGIAVTKTPSRTTYNAAGQAIVYTFTLKNVGNVTLYGPFTVTDVPLGQVDCAGASLDPGATLTTCETKTYTTTQADLDGNDTITDTATGHAFADIILVADVAPNARVQVDSNTVTVNVTASQGAELTLVKAATETSFTLAGDVIHYTYTLTNTGNVTLDGPFTVVDDKITDPNKVVCNAADGLQLTPGQSVTCTASYTVTLADLDAGKVVNTAVGHARLVESDVASTAKVVTVTQKGLETVLAETAGPSHGVTPPPTNGDAGSSNGNPAPLLALLICLAFGGLGLLAVGAQRRSIRR